MKDNNLLDEPENETPLSEIEQEAKSKVKVLIFAFPIIFVGLLLYVLSQCSSNEILG